MYISVLAHFGIKVKGKRKKYLHALSAADPSTVPRVAACCRVRTRYSQVSPLCRCYFLILTLWVGVHASKCVYISHLRPDFMFDKFLDLPCCRKQEELWRAVEKIFTMTNFRENFRLKGAVCLSNWILQSNFWRKYGV